MLFLRASVACFATGHCLLVVVCNGFPAAVMGTLSLAAGQLLVWNCILPSDDKAPTAMLCFCTCIVVCSLTFVFWRSRGKVYLDKICINQTDAKLRTEGVLNVGAFLRSSKSMLVCWDTTYMRRLGLGQSEVVPGLYCYGVRSDRTPEQALQEFEGLQHTRCQCQGNMCDILTGLGR